jgi:hypothetical protein
MAKPDKAGGLPSGAPFDLNKPLGEIIAEIQAEDRKLDGPMDQYVGATPAQIEEREALADAQAPPPEDPTSRLERKIKLLEEQLAENMELVQKIAKDRGGYSAVAREVALIQAAMERRSTYDRIRTKGGLCTVLIHTHEDPAQNWPVPLGVNGNLLIVRRGDATVLPVEHLEVLDNAVYDVWTKELDVDENPRLVHYQRLSYPYSLLDEQPAAVDVPRVAA